MTSGRQSHKVIPGVALASGLCGTADACCFRRRHREPQRSCQHTATTLIDPGHEIKTTGRVISPYDTVGPGPVYTSGPVYIINGQAIKFVFRTGALLNDAASAQAVIARGRQNFPSHVWDNTKYWVTLDTASNSYLLIGWYNRDTGGYGWVGVLNTPDTWWFRADGRWTALPEPNAWDGRQWGFGAETVTLYIKNPRNVNGFTPNDIIYKVGWTY
jgi:hypothetical protein